MTTDTAALQERIEAALIRATDDGADRTEEYAAAVLPIVAAEAQAASEKAWDEGHSWGWSDAQEAHDTRQVMPRSEWRLCTPNPYREQPPRQPPWGHDWANRGVSCSTCDDGGCPDCTDPTD